jgi:hypothetical protein
MKKRNKINLPPTDKLFPIDYYILDGLLRLKEDQRLDIYLYKYYKLEYLLLHLKGKYNMAG